jgi:hypothetical protein
LLDGLAGTAVEIVRPKKADIAGLESVSGYKRAIEHPAAT